MAIIASAGMRPVVEILSVMPNKELRASGQLYSSDNSPAIRRRSCSIDRKDIAIISATSCDMNGKDVIGVAE
jgi:hypothetical protein